MKGNKLVQLILRYSPVKQRNRTSSRKLGEGFCGKFREYLLACLGFCEALAANVPYHVPLGHVAVYGGLRHKRFVIRVSHLNHTAFRALLEKAKEEYGFDPRRPITFPCDEDTLQYIVDLVRMKKLFIRDAHLDEDELDLPFICQFDRS